MARRVPKVDKKFNYCHVRFDHEKFCPVTEALPREYDLLKLKTINSNVQYPGWFTGNSFHIPKLKNKLYKVTHWKLDEDE